MLEQYETEIIVYRSSAYFIPLWLTWTQIKSNWQVQKISLIPLKNLKSMYQIVDNTKLKNSIQQWEKNLALLQKIQTNWDDFCNAYLLDRSVFSPFQIKVYQYLVRVPWGQKISYEQLAQQCDTHPRAIGTAMRINPFPIIIPCHRVLRKDGSLGGFSSGIENKKKILEYERN